ncbi:MAG: hypothetical protein ACQEST_05855 [Bacteroidota bacterium]
MSVLFLGLTADISRGQDFEEWKENYLNEFEEFQNEHDKEFHEMLQNEWEEFAGENSPEFYEEPKPDVIPGVEETSPTDSTPQKPKEEKKENRTEREDKPSEPKASPSEESPKPAAEQKTEQRTNNSAPKDLSPTFSPNVEKAEIESQRLNYFGVPIHYKYYSAYKTQIDRPVEKESISKFWKHLSTKDYPAFLEQIQQVRSELSLNDYGYAQLLNNIGTQIYGSDTHEAKLFTWFMLTQSGFGTKIAFNKQNIFLLVKANPNVLNTTYFRIDGSKYYGINFDQNYSELPSNLYTYEGDHPKSKKREIDLRFSKLPDIPQEHEERSLQFTFRDSTYTINVPVDKQVVNYFKNYPKADLDLYFNSQMDGQTHQQLLSSLEPLLEEKSTLEQVNLLLRFTQRSFEYETDQDQFNTEKKMFPMETLYYPASDCDDRTILLAYLIEELTDLEYVVVRYPGHLTLAVHFPDEKPEGPRVNSPITYNGKSYYVSDPTYFGADAGMVMTKFQDTRPKEVFKF